MRGTINMRSKRLFLLVLSAAALFASVAAEAAVHRDKRDRRPPSVHRPHLSEETRKLAAVCRRDPSEENRSALRKKIEVDYDRFLEEQRAKIKDGKHDRKHQEARRRLNAMVRDRKKRVDEIMRRLLNPPEHTEEHPSHGPKNRHRD